MNKTETKKASKNSSEKNSFDDTIEKFQLSLGSLKNTFSSSKSCF